MTEWWSYMGDVGMILQEAKKFRESIDRLTVAVTGLTERLTGLEETLDAVFNLEKEDDK